MEEKRAKSAVCRRADGEASCGMGVAVGDPEKAKSISCSYDGDSCGLDWNGNEWMELGLRVRGMG